MVHLYQIMTVAHTEHQTEGELQFQKLLNMYHYNLMEENLLQLIISLKDVLFWCFHVVTILFLLLL